MIQWDNVHKLVTREDPTHFHKVLGAGAILHYLYRIAHFARYGTMGFRDPWDTAAFILMHTALSLSSLIFHVHRNRVRSKPMIYSEFRVHSIIFACRSFAAMLVYNDAIASAIIVLATMTAADIATWYYKSVSSTMRDMPFPDSISQRWQCRINMYYSICQVFATLAMLSGNIERIFLTALPIQLAAFLMTLVRKSIISSATWHAVYAGSLALPFIHGIAQAHETPRDLQMWVCAALFCTLRFRYHVNKYLLWVPIIAARF